MRAALDTNVLFDLLAGEDVASAAASDTLAAVAAVGSLVICPVVYAELATSFDQAQDMARFLRDLGVELEAFSGQALQHTAQAWRAYTRRRGRQVQCPRCGHLADLHCPACQATIAWRQHIISDFLVGGHAAVQADLLITRDSGYYRTYFPQLRLEVPTSA